MNSETKVLIPDTEWLVKNNNLKIGSVAKSKEGYSFLCNGQKIDFTDLSEISARFGLVIAESNFKNSNQQSIEKNSHAIYDYPCSSEPYEPVYSVRRKLPLFSKSSKSKSQYCAGHYIIKFRKGWVKSFCPKLITLERYPFHGPFKTEVEMKNILNTINKS